MWCVQIVMGVLVLLSIEPSATPSATVADVKSSSASPSTPAVASTTTKGIFLYVTGTTILGICITLSSSKLEDASERANGTWELQRAAIVELFTRPLDHLWFIQPHHHIPRQHLGNSSHPLSWNR